MSYLDDNQVDAPEEPKVREKRFWPISITRVHDHDFDWSVKRGKSQIRVHTWGWMGWLMSKLMKKPRIDHIDPLEKMLDDQKG